MKKISAILLIFTIIASMVCLPVSGAEQTDLERVQELIDLLPASYKVGNGDIIAEIDALIEENGFTKISTVHLKTIFRKSQMIFLLTMKIRISE